MTKTTDDGKLSTSEAERTTGEFQPDGTETVDGTETHDETATATTAVDGTVATALDETELGTCDHSTITADGDEAIVMINEAGSDETSETATTTGEPQLVGT
jgi:hypothetical protein